MALLHKVVKKHFGDVKVVGAEIWTQIRKLDAGMHLHFDRDEKLYNDHNELITPFISSVVYLTDIGGPTIILEQQPGVSFFNHTTPIWTPFSPTKAEAGYAVYPHKNRCVFFQGGTHYTVHRSQSPPHTLSLSLPFEMCVYVCVRRPVSWRAA